MRFALAFTLLVCSVPLSAQTPSEPAGEKTEPVAVIVTIPTPPGAPRSAIEAGIDKSVPLYRTVPGLLRKYFTISDANFGGIYLFASRVDAEKWFSPAWAARVQSTYGGPATVTYADVPVVLDNAELPTGLVPAQ